MKYQSNFSGPLQSHQIATLERSQSPILKTVWPVKQFKKRVRMKHFKNLAKLVSSSWLKRISIMKNFCHLIKNVRTKNDFLYFIGRPRRTWKILTVSNKKPKSAIQCRIFGWYSVPLAISTGCWSSSKWRLFSPITACNWSWTLFLTFWSTSASKLLIAKVSLHFNCFKLEQVWYIFFFTYPHNKK